HFLLDEVGQDVVPPVLDGHVLERSADHGTRDAELLNVHGKALRTQTSGGHPNVTVSVAVVVDQAGFAGSVTDGVAGAYYRVVDGAAGGWRPARPARIGRAGAATELATRREG